MGRNIKAYKTFSKNLGFFPALINEGERPGGESPVT